MNYFVDEKREESSSDYSLVMILHSSTGLENWLTRSTAIRIRVVNTDMNTGGGGGGEEYQEL